MSGQTTLLWFRSDLRLTDNPALRAALEDGGTVVPIFLWPNDTSPFAPGAAARWWLHHSLQSLRESLEERGSRLVLRSGPPGRALQGLCRETGADAVFWNRRYEPSGRAEDRQIQSCLESEGIRVQTFSGNLLYEPDEITTQTGGSYQVFTPFWKRCCDRPLPADPLPNPRSVRSPDEWPESLSLDELQLLPRIDWAEGFRHRWKPGEGGAKTRWREFLEHEIAGYYHSRDRMDLAGTSALSPHLHFGEISVRQIWSDLTARFGPPRPVEKRQRSGDLVFRSELGWREFAHHVLHHHPDTPDQPLRPPFEAFPWVDSPADLKAWQRGETGYPIVDAGMRQLWRTGWMHNRARMIVGSFLTKDLRVSWVEGARWFWDTLVDADLANNTLGWQWVAGCGADAAPYFRVFNPVLQGERYDPEGEFVRRWVPELARLPANVIHAPWEADAQTLKDAKVRLGETYPRPIVDHSAARKDALKAWESIRG